MTTEDDENRGEPGSEERIQHYAELASAGIGLFKSEDDFTVEEIRRNCGPKRTRGRVVKTHHEIPTSDAYGHK